MSTIVEQERASRQARGAEIRGYLYGVLNPTLGILDPAAGAEVVAVTASGKADGGPRQMTEDEFRQAVEREGRILRAMADDHGAFRFDGDEGDEGDEGDGDGYGDGDGDELFDLYAVIDSIPMPTHSLQEMPLPKPEYLYIGRQQPSWPERGPTSS